MVPLPIAINSLISGEGLYLKVVNYLCFSEPSLPRELQCRTQLARQILDKKLAALR